MHLLLARRCAIMSGEKRRARLSVPAVDDSNGQHDNDDNEMEHTDFASSQLPPSQLRSKRRLNNDCVAVASHSTPPLLPVPLGNSSLPPSSSSSASSPSTPVIVAAPLEKPHCQIPSNSVVTVSTAGSASLFYPTNRPSRLKLRVKRSLRGDTPKPWTSTMEEAAAVLDNAILEDLTNIIMHYMLDVPPSGQLVRSKSFWMETGGFYEQSGAMTVHTHPRNTALFGCESVVVAADQNRIYVIRLSDLELVSVFVAGFQDSMHVGGMAVSEEGHIFMSDTANHSMSVTHIATADTLIRRWGSVGGADRDPGQFCRPKGVAIGKDGLVFVADTGNHRIQLFNQDGTFVRFFGYFVGQITCPTGICIRNGLVYVTEPINYCVTVFAESDGSFVRQIGSRLDFMTCQLKLPHNVSCGDSWLAVSDVNHQINLLRSDGSFVRRWGPDDKLFGPICLCWSDSTDELVAFCRESECGRHRVVVYV